MSPTVATMPGQPKNPKGKRIPGKPGRFSPDRPFHMSTRRRNKNSISGSAPSLNGSVEEFESRRQSLDAERPVTAQSNGTEASKGTCTSDFSPPQPIPDIDMSETAPISSTEYAIDDERRSRSPSRVQQTLLSLTLKRKRSSASPPPAAKSDVLNQDDDFQPEALDPDYQYDSDNVQVVHQDDLSDREDDGEEIDQGDEAKDDSPTSSRSQEIVPPYDAMAGTSADVTPMLSEQASPVTSGSAEDDGQEPDTTIAKPLAAALDEVAKAKEVTPVEPELPEDASMLDVAQAVEDADEIEEQVRTDDEGRMVVRRGRFGGRRRAQHPNTNIEMAMRRQAHLKSAYRAIARAQKGLLAEVTSRTIDDLEASPTYHTEVLEYQAIVRELDSALAKRKATIQAQHDMRLKQLKVTMNGERYATISKCRQQLKDVEEGKVDQLQYELLRVARSAQLDDGHETEDEDDVIPRLKRTAYHFKRANGLEPVYDSRSWLAIETQQATEDMQSRYDMYEMLKDLPQDVKPEKRDGFTIMDERPRTAASKNREGQDNLGVLAAAGAEAERVAKIPIIPNDQAIGLKILSDLASRPSITGGRPESSGSAAGPANNLSGLPQLQVQMPSRHSPIQVTMSPRTQHAMGNRFEAGHMPPPLTPRQELRFLDDRSPDPRRHDRQHSTPIQDERANGLQPRSSTETLRSPARPAANEANTLQNRIASRDGALQDSLFGSPRAFLDFPGFRQFEPPGGPRRRAASHSDPSPPFGTQADPISRMLRGEHLRETDRKDKQEKPTTGSRMFDPVRSQTSTLPDQHSRADASNGRSHETASPKSENLSIGGNSGQQNFTTLGQGISIEPSTAHHVKRNSKGGGNYHKTNVQQRNGKSRKQAAKESKQQRQFENGGPEAAGPSAMSASHFMGSPGLGMRPSSPWSGGPPSMHSPNEFGPLPAGPHHHSASYGHPSGFSHPPAPSSSSLPPHLQRQGSFDLSNLHHRESFPPPLIAPPHHSTFFPILNQPHNQPPPPGLTPEQWRPGPGGPPGMPNFRPPPPPHLPHEPLPPGAPFPRGTPIAPAGGPGTPGAFNPGPFRPANNHPPAFAQQQQQQNGGGSGSNGNGGSRRRTQSDVGFAKFQPLWEPPGNRRKGG